MARLGNILQLLFPELIILSCVKLSHNAVVPDENKWTKTTELEKPRIAADSPITLNLYDANGEWGVLSVETSNDLGQNGDSSDYHFDVNIDSLGQVIQEVNDIPVQESVYDGYEDQTLDKVTEIDQNTEHLKVNKTKPNRLKRSTSRRRPPSRRTEPRRPPTPPPQNVPEAPWQINQGQI